MNELMPVPASAVRVWRGYMRSDLTPQEFRSKLGSVFIPATVQIQRNFGLTAYLPAVLPASPSCDLPDEVALVFYGSQQQYLDTKKHVLGRVYSDLHKTLFADKSVSGFPFPLDDTQKLDTPYYLLSNEVDWQVGDSAIVVLARNQASESDFRGACRRRLKAIVGLATKGIDGAIFCDSQNWSIWWLHGPPTGVDRGRKYLVDGIGTVLVNRHFDPKSIEIDLLHDYQGIDVNVADALNTQFTRIRT